jgi:hypothetical protein
VSGLEASIIFISLDWTVVITYDKKLWKLSSARPREECANMHTSRQFILLEVKVTRNARFFIYVLMGVKCLLMNE